jgi:hypothetical protein
MTRDKIIELMLKADAIEGVEEDGSIFVEFSERQLMTFVALVIAAEREACAKLAGPHLGGQIAAAIRARGEV